MDVTWARWARAGLWLLPVYGLLTLLGTLTHQPDPATEFSAWSDYVTTGRFYASHIGASILGLSLGTLGTMSLALLLTAGRRPNAALSGLVLHVVGSGGVLAMFGVAAFVQPAMGRAFLDGETAAAQGWYDAVFNSATTLVPAISGVLLFSVASILIGWSLAARSRVPLWAAIAYGISSPLIGLLGIVMGVLQTVGSVALVAAGVVIAVRLGESAAEPDSRATPRAPGPVSTR